MCLVEEHVMASSAEFGPAVRAVVDRSRQRERLDEAFHRRSSATESFVSIRREMEEAQRAEGGDESDVDYFFEIPLKTAQSIVGFKHDEECPHISEGSFAVLSRPATKKAFLASSSVDDEPAERP